jgi:hypothetical protein
LQYQDPVGSNQNRPKTNIFQAKAALVAEQCRMTGLAAGCPWAFENPVSVFSSIFGSADYTFHPYQFTGLCEDDNYATDLPLDR